MVHDYTPQGDVVIRLEGSEDKVISIRVAIHDFTRAIGHLGENVSAWVSGGENE